MAVAAAAKEEMMMVWVENAGRTRIAEGWVRVVVERSFVVKYALVW